MAEDTYGHHRADRLLQLLRALAARIEALKKDEDLLGAGPELMKLMGDARSELFRYEVRSTYDTPEVAKSRKIVDEARRKQEHLDLKSGQEPQWSDPEEDTPWQDQ